jgi:hypothetical protein
MPAFRANGVREAHRTAIGAGNEIAGLQGIVGAAAIAASLGMFGLGMWCHDFLLILLIKRQERLKLALLKFQQSGQIIAAEGSDVKTKTL